MYDIEMKINEEISFSRNKSLGEFIWSSQNASAFKSLSAAITELNTLKYFRKAGKLQKQDIIVYALNHYGLEAITCTILETHSRRPVYTVHRLAGLLSNGPVRLKIITGPIMKRVPMWLSAKGFTFDRAEAAKHKTVEEVQELITVEFLGMLSQAYPENDIHVTVEQGNVHITNIATHIFTNLYRR